MQATETAKSKVTIESDEIYIPGVDFYLTVIEGAEGAFGRRSPFKFGDLLACSAVEEDVRAGDLIVDVDASPNDGGVFIRRLRDLKVEKGRGRGKLVAECKSNISREMLADLHEQPERFIYYGRVLYVHRAVERKCLCGGPLTAFIEVTG